MVLVESAEQSRKLSNGLQLWYSRGVDACLMINRIKKMNVLTCSGVDPCNKAMMSITKPQVF